MWHKLILKCSYLTSREKEAKAKRESHCLLDCSFNSSWHSYFTGPRHQRLRHNKHWSLSEEFPWALHFPFNYKQVHTLATLFPFSPTGICFRLCVFMLEKILEFQRRFLDIWPWHTINIYLSELQTLRSSYPCQHPQGSFICRKQNWVKRQKVPAKEAGHHCLHHHR